MLYLKCTQIRPCWLGLHNGWEALVASQPTGQTMLLAPIASLSTERLDPRHVLVAHSLKAAALQSVTDSSSLLLSTPVQITVDAQSLDHGRYAGVRT